MRYTTITAVVFFWLGLTSSVLLAQQTLEASAGDLVRGQSINRAVYKLDFTVQLLNAGDAGTVGVELILRNASTTQPLELSRKRGEVPISVVLYQEKDALPLPDGSGVSMQPLTPRNTVRKTETSLSPRIFWAIPPEGTEKYFLPISELFETLPKIPLIECTLSVRPLIMPPKEYWSRRTPRRAPYQDSDALVIHSSLRDVKFKNVTLTKEGLSMDARKLYERLLEGEK